MNQFEQNLLDVALDYSNKFNVTDLSKKQIVMAWMSGALWVVGMVLRHSQRLSVRDWEKALTTAGHELGFDKQTLE